MPEDRKARTTADLIAVTNGDSGSVERLFTEVYAELRLVAGRIFRGQSPRTLQPTALVNEAYLKLVEHADAGWSGRSHFLAVAARAMRQVLVDDHRQRGAAKRGGDRERCSLSGVEMGLPKAELDPIDLDSALSKLAQLDEREARVVELRFYSGLGMDEIASVLGVSKSTVEGDWRHARAWLHRELS